MTDLSHWDFEESFTAKEIAALVRGVDPSVADAPEIQANDPVLRRVAQGYDAAYSELAIQWYATIEFDLQECLAAMDPACLRCKRMYIEWDELFREAFERGMLERWELQEFDRSEIARWLNHMGFHSKYAFSAVSVTGDSTAKEMQPTLPQRPIKGTLLKQRACQIIALSKAFGFGHPRDIDTPPGNKPGRKCEIWTAFSKQYPGVGRGSFNAAWTFARGITD